MMETEAHVYALAVSASVLLAFFPFVVVMLAFCRSVLHWPAAEQAVYLAVGDLLGDRDGFLVRNLRDFNLSHVRLTSMFLLLFTANGVFEPLEVALNRAWGVTANRSYMKNQMISLGLILACGGLMVLSLMFTGLNSQWLAAVGLDGGVGTWITRLFFKIAALPVSIFALFLVYWLLPNRKIDPSRVVPVATAVGLILEALKYVNILVAGPLERKLAREYSIFQHSVAILLWSAVGALIVLAGAHWTARHDTQDPLS